MSSITLSDKRRIDSEITSIFLSNQDINQTIVKNIVNSLIQNLESSFKKYSSLFYLKGGNAFSILHGDLCTGDFDFQLCGNESLYQNWTSIFPSLDEDIKKAMQKVCDNYTGEFDDHAFGENNNLSDYIALNYEQGSMFIGEKYKTYTYTQILQDSHFDLTSSRIEFKDSNNIVSKTIETKQCKPMWYVNYTIPGFILYRIVIRRAYTDKAENIVHFKSEMIDISVPRKGSPELLLNQRFITNFIDVSSKSSIYKGFNIPNWGYHMYENLNLLQEINLGISGSPHKKQKRINRLNEAIKQIKKQDNPDIFVDDMINEDVQQKFKIYGITKAYLNNIDNYGIFGEEAIAKVKEKVKSKILSICNNEAITLIDELTNTQGINSFPTMDKIKLSLMSALEINNAEDLKKLKTLFYDFRMKPNEVLHSYWIVVGCDSNLFAQVKCESVDQLYADKNDKVIQLRLPGHNIFCLIHKLSDEVYWPSKESVLCKTLFESDRYTLSIGYLREKTNRV